MIPAPASRLAAFFLAAGLFAPASGAPEPKPDADPMTLPGTRIDLYDSATRRIQMVLYCPKPVRQPSGEVLCEDFRALILEKEGTSLEQMIERPLGEVKGRKARYDAAQGTLQVEEARTRFRGDPFGPAGTPSEKPVPAGPDAKKEDPYIEIDAKDLEIRSRESRAVYRREVRMRHAGAVLHAEDLVVAWDAGAKALTDARAAGTPVVAVLAGGERLEAPEMSIFFPSRRLHCPKGGVFEFRTEAKGLTRLQGAK